MIFFLGEVLKKPAIEKLFIKKNYFMEQQYTEGFGKFIAPLLTAIILIIAGLHYKKSETLKQRRLGNVIFFGGLFILLLLFALWLLIFSN